MKCKKCGKEVEVTHKGLCLSCYMIRPAENPCEFNVETYWDNQLKNLGFKSAADSDNLKRDENENK